MPWWGLLPLGFYGIHWGYQLRLGHPENGLWACHVAALVIGVGLLASSATLVTVGLLWLAVGIPLWIFDLLVGGESAPTSVLTHLGGVVVGLIGLHDLEMPDPAWWKALLAIGALQHLCRWVTPEKENVNAAFAVYAPFQRWFSSYRWYQLATALTLGIVFFVAEYGLRKLMY